MILQDVGMDSIVAPEAVWDEFFNSIGQKQPIGLAAWTAGFGSESGCSKVTAWAVKVDPKRSYEALR